uniref:NADH-ubiquinone oxidoreductase chain 4L n=1 Tax=Bostrichoidea sp. 9 KM-2017 TaxID=2219283 RepID=A0A346RH29_9COLE|nr:NADH dehydrogenase subunit 4L [Bostrichoidea sp. 9 KM-2017]
MLMGLFTYIYGAGAVSFVMKRKHLLLLLLSLEFMIVALYFGLSFIFCFTVSEFFFLMIFLTMSVCESALGLSVLVSLIRVYGNDYFSTFSILW